MLATIIISHRLITYVGQSGKATDLGTIWQQTSSDMISIPEVPAENYCDLECVS